jgi:protein TonB
MVPVATRAASAHTESAALEIRTPASATAPQTHTAPHPPADRAPAASRSVTEPAVPPSASAPTRTVAQPAAASTDDPSPLPAPAITAATRTTSQTVVDRAGLRRDYLEQLIAHIEGFKQFPALARRRRIEGRVNVDLAVDCDGAVTALDTRSGPGLLQAATRRSVRSAQPLPAPPPQLGCPQQLGYAMVYRLQH